MAQGAVTPEPAQGAVAVGAPVSVPTARLSQAQGDEPLDIGHLSRNVERAEAPRFVRASCARFLDQIRMLGSWLARRAAARLTTGPARRALSTGAEEYEESVHDMLQQTCRDFVNAKLKPIAAELDKNHRWARTAPHVRRTGDCAVAVVPVWGQLSRSRVRRYPAEIISQMAELGLMGVMIPEEYGGTGMDALAYAIAMEEISAGCASTGGARLPPQRLSPPASSRARLSTLRSTPPHLPIPSAPAPKSSCLSTTRSTATR
jgi:hypothetical protein